MLIKCVLSHFFSLKTPSSGEKFNKVYKNEVKMYLMTRIDIIVTFHAKTAIYIRYFNQSCKTAILYRFGGSGHKIPHKPLLPPWIDPKTFCSQTWDHMKAICENLACTNMSWPLWNLSYVHKMRFFTPFWLKNAI